MQDLKDKKKAENVIEVDPNKIDKNHDKNPSDFFCEKGKIVTQNNGKKIGDHQNSLTVGPNGPILLQDLVLLEKHQKFNRERIPERNVHAKGSGALGYFEVTDDITKYTKANIFSEIGKKTPLLVRFSQVAGEKGAPDTDRDPRGFAIKFYTEEGNWDLVCNDFPVFFIRDGMLFPDFIHSQKKNPHSNLPDTDAFWDFLSYHPESAHMLTMLFSDRGTPASYRNIHAFGNHTFKLVNKNNEVHFVKFHIKADTGFISMTNESSKNIKKEDCDYLRRDLYDHLKSGKEVNYTMFIQVMPEKDAEKYKFNILDVTKVWYHADYPLIKVGKLVLNKYPTNFFAEIEQAAFCPATLVTGIEVTNDRMLQTRIFAYKDTQFHRLGANFAQLPVNCPYRTKVYNYERDGAALYDSQKSGFPNYYPNSYDGPVDNKEFNIQQFDCNGKVGNYEFNHPNDDYEQPRALWERVMDDNQRDHLIDNLVDHMKWAKPEVIII